MKVLKIGEEYVGKGGKKQMKWNAIGILFEGQNGKQYVKLNHIPNVLIHVFEPQPRQDGLPGEDEVGF